MRISDWSSDVCSSDLQAALLLRAHRDVVVFVAHDRKLRQQRVAVMAFGIDRVAAIGEVLADRVGKKYVLRRLRPRWHAHRMGFVAAEHFLQEHEVGGLDRKSTRRKSSN